MVTTAIWAHICIKILKDPPCLSIFPLEHVSPCPSKNWLRILFGILHPQTISMKAKGDAGTKQWKAGKLLAAFHTTEKSSSSFSKLWHLCEHLMPVRTLPKSVLSLSAEEHGGFCAGRTVSLLFPAQIGGHQKTHGSLSATFLQYKGCPGEL